MLSDDATDILLQEDPKANELPEFVVALLEREAESMEFEHSEVGKTADGQTIELYTLENSQGTRVKLINYGATVVSVETVDKHGKAANIVLGHNSVDNWLKNPCYFGCTVGRYANRIGNGIFGLSPKTTATITCTEVFKGFLACYGTQKQLPTRHREALCFQEQVLTEKTATQGLLIPR